MKQIRMNKGEMSCLFFHLFLMIHGAWTSLKMVTSSMDLFCVFLQLGGMGRGRGVTLGWVLLHHFNVLSTFCTLCTGSRPQNMGVSCQGLRSTECKNTHTLSLSLSFLYKNMPPLQIKHPEILNMKWDVVVPGWVVFITKHKW
jgi:hypothetical protein